jgi:hypothetical protein
MNYTSFQAFAHRYTQAMLAKGKKGVRVTFGGDQAWTAPGRLNLPALPAGTIMSHWQMKVWHGFVDHELCHQEYTDFGVLEKKKLDRLEQWLNNVFEDVRIEKLWIKELPGSHDYLDALCQYIDVEQPKVGGSEHRATNSLDKALQLLYNYCWATFRDVDTHTTTNVLGDLQSMAPVKQLLDQEFKGLKNSAQTLDLALRVAKLIRDKVKTGELPNEVKSEGDPAGAGQGGQRVLEQMLAALGVKDGHEARGEAMKEIIAKVMEENGKDLKGTSKGKEPMRDGTEVLPPFTTQHDKIFVYPHEDHRQYNATLAQTSAEVSAIKKMLRIFLQSRNKKSWTRGLEEGVLDAEALHLFESGRKDLMKERRERDATDTAVGLMVDLSSSMDDELVRAAAICIAEAVSAVPYVKLAIAGFATQGRYLSYDDRNKAPPGFKAGRLDPMNIYLFKDFSEPLNAAKGHLGAIRADGGTPLGEGYGHMLERLLTRKERKKVLWLVTDGSPSFSKYSHEHSDYLLMKGLKHRCERLGIETVGLDIEQYGGMNSRGLTKPFVKTHFACSQMSDLPTVIMNTLKGLV